MKAFLIYSDNSFGPYSADRFTAADTVKSVIIG